MASLHQESFQYTKSSVHKLERLFIAGLPAHVTNDRKIRESIQPFLKEIIGLQKKLGYCYASNAYLANLLNIHQRTVQKRLFALSKAGYIRIELFRSGFSCQRKIYLSDSFKISLNHAHLGVHKIEDSSSRDKSLSSEKKRTKNEEKSKRNSFVLSSPPQAEDKTEPMGYDHLCKQVQKAQEGMRPEEVQKRGIKKTDIRSWLNHYLYDDVKMTIDHVLSLKVKRSTPAYIQSLLKKKFAQNERNMALNRKLAMAVIKEEEATHLQVMKKYVIDSITKISYMLNLDPGTFKAQIITSMKAAERDSIERMSIEEYREMLRRNGV